MADDDQKVDPSTDSSSKALASEEAQAKVEEAKEEAEEAAEKAEEKAEDAQEAAAEAKEAAEKVEEVVEKAKPSVKVSPALGKIIKSIEELSVIELSELVKALETRFGVSAAAPVAAVAAGAQAAGADEGVSEQTTFNVILADSGSNKIGVIKAVRELVPTLGLKEAKDLVDAPPKPILEGVNKDNANEAKTKLEAAGAKVELK